MLAPLPTSNGAGFRNPLHLPVGNDEPLEKQYQRSCAAGKERMLSIFLVAMAIMTVAQVPFFELEDPVQVFRLGSFLLIYVYSCLLRVLFHFYPTSSFYWDYFVFVGATHMIVSYSMSHNRVAELLGERLSGSSSEDEMNSQISIASVLLGVGLLLKIRWQFFAALAILTPTCYFGVGTVWACQACEHGASNLEMGAVHLVGLGLLILIGVVLNERDRRCLWESCCNYAHIMGKLKIAHSLRERLLRSVFDVSFAAQMTESGDLQVVGEWPALDHFVGIPMANSNLSAHMPSRDRERFLEYVRLAVNNTDEAIPACLLPVHFEPEPGCSLPANMYIVSAAEEKVLTVCLSTKAAEADGFETYMCKKNGGMAAASALAAHIKNTATEPPAKNYLTQRAPPSLHSAPTEMLRAKEKTRLLSACEDDCLPPDSIAWVEGQSLPQPLKALHAGQKVLCHDNMSKGLKYADILEVRTETGSAKWVNVLLEDGTSLPMTANHPVMPLSDGGNGSTGTVRAIDLCPGSDYLMVLKTMPVLVQEVISGTVNEGEDRVFLTLHQPQRHSIFVAAPPGGGSMAPSVMTMAVGSADALPRYDLSSNNTFIDIPLEQPVLKRSNSAPPAYREAQFNPTISSASAVTSSRSDSSIAPLSDFSNVDILISPPHQPAWHVTAGGTSSLIMQPRPSADSVALSEVLSIQSVSLRSFGSLGHADGSCKACIFANRAEHAGGAPCWKGVFCERCHEGHNPVAHRRAKTGRQRERQRLTLV